MAEPPEDRVLDYATPQQRPIARPLIWLLLGGAAIFFLLSIVVFEPRGSREPANRVQCRANLNTIGAALQVYTLDHAGQFPDSLGDLLASDPTLFACLICPSGTDVEVRSATTQAMLAELAQPGHCSFIYLGKGQRSGLPANFVLAYEPLSNHNKKGANVLRGDGRAEWLNDADLAKLLAELNAGHNPPRAR